MSLIENAIRKAQQVGGAKPAEARRPRGRQQSVSEVGATATPRVFRSLQLDPSVLARKQVYTHLSDGAAVRAYKILRTRVLQRMQSNQWHSLAISATAPGEGKTLTAINLSIALAQDASTSVFLVDLDLQRPQVAGYLGMRADKGVMDFLAGDAALEDICYNVGVDRLTVIPNLQTVENSSEFLAAPRMQELIEALAAERPRPIVVFDLPPLLASDDVLGFAPNADCMLLVVGEGVGARASLESAKETLADMNLLGVVLNRTRERDDTPYYY